MSLQSQTMPNHARSTLKILALAGTVVAFFIFHIWFRTEVLTKGFEVDVDRRSLQKLESQLMELKVERNKYMGPESLEKLVGRLQATGVEFSAPRSNQLIYLNRADSKAETKADSKELAKRR